MKDTIRLSVAFPRGEYRFLKMLCAHRGCSVDDFATGALVKAIEAAEDAYLAKKALAVMKRIESGKEPTFSLEQVRRSAKTSTAQSPQKRRTSQRPVPQRAHE